MSFNFQMFHFNLLLNEQCKGNTVASYPGSSPCQKAGREPGRSDHVPRDVLCVVLCVVLIIELLPTLSVLSVISGTHVLLCVAETTDWH